MEAALLGFLSNLRDVKGALSAGMLLLFAVWLVIGEQIARVRPGDTMVGKVATLTDYLGPVATIAAVAFLAYVVGLVLPFHSLVLYGIQRHNRKKAAREGAKRQESRLLDFVLDLITQAERKKPLGELTRDLLREIPALTRIKMRYPWWIRFSPTCVAACLERRWDQKVIRQALDEKKPPKRKSKTDTSARTERKRLAAVLLRCIYKESSLLAVDLGHKDDKAYERFDKARGEAEFRAALCVPLLILTVVIALQLGSSQNPWGSLGVFGIGCFAVLVLVARATRKAEEAQEEVNSAIILGRIKVSELQVLEATINTEVALEAPPSGRPRRTWRRGGP